MKTMIIGAVIALTLTTPAAANLITNGDFETGTFAGWSAGVQSGSNGNLFVTATGANSPQSGFATQSNSSGGSFFAITDQGGPGSYSLTQAFTLASASKVTVKFDLFASDQAGVILNNGRSYATGANQNAVADILVGGAGAFTEAAGDIVGVLYGPGADSLTGNPNPWTSYTSTVTLAAGTYQIRFAETDNQGFFQMGVDNVSVTAGVPEASTWAMMIAGFGLVGAAARRRSGIVAA